MPEKISILKESGEVLTSNIVSVFTIPDTEKRYIITTENAVDPHGLTVLHVSEIVDNTLQKIATDDEWSSIKTIMRAIISGNVGSYKYLPIIEKASANGQYSRDISVSASASKQMIDNYNLGDKGNGGAAPALDAPVAPTPAAPVQTSTIFPTDGGVVSNDDEVAPGIAELNESVPEAPVTQPVTPEVQPVTPEPVAPVVAEPVAPQVTPTPGGQVTVASVAVPQPVTPAPLEPAPAPVVPTAPVEPVTPTVAPVVTEEPVVSTEAVVTDISSTPETEVPAAVSMLNTEAALDVAQNVTPEPVAPIVPDALGPVTPPAEPAEVQVAMPTAMVPDAQIVQGVQTPANDTTPSFAPDATLDEVVLGAQQMFMEGVKNLVQTIQEKVYRDLYAKEAELKSREALIEEKEKNLNNPVTPASQPVAPVSVEPVVPAPVTPLAPTTPVVPQPTVVETPPSAI